MYSDKIDVHFSPVDSISNRFVGAETAEHFLFLRGIETPRDKELVLLRQTTRKRIVHLAETHFPLKGRVG